MIPIIDLFLFGTLWFWLFWAFVTICIITSLEREKFWYSNLLVLVGVGLLVYNVKLIGWLTWQNALEVIGAYLLAGSLWSVFKWWRHCRSRLEDAKRATREATSGGAKNLDYVWMQQQLTRELSASDNKGRICAWIVYWPWSFVWNISRETINTIFDWLRGIYDSISNKALKEFSGAIPTKTEETKGTGSRPTF